MRKINLSTTVLLESERVTPDMFRIAIPKALINYIEEDGDSYILYAIVEQEVSK